MKWSQHKNFLKLRRSVLVHCLLPLIIATGIYIWLRPHSFFGGYFTNKEVSIDPLSGGLSVIVYHLPDFLWAYSFSYALLWYRCYHFKSISRIYAAAVLMLLLLSEGIQLLVPRYFTFDVWDLLCCAAAFVLSYSSITAYHEK